MKRLVREGALGDTAPMEILETQADSSANAFRANAEHHKALADDLAARLARVRDGGGAPARALHTKRAKLFVRDRIDALLDEGSPFLELSPLAATDLYEGAAPAAGIVTGIGRVAGRLVMIVANDATVNGGT